MADSAQLPPIHSTPPSSAQADPPKKEWIQRLSVIPGALMIVPLLLGALINTLFPSALLIGGFTTGLFKTGLPSILGLFFFCMGAQLDFRTTRPTLEKGVSLLLGKVTAGVTAGMLVAFLSPSGTLLGLTPMVIIAGMTNSNGALYAALTGSFGNKVDRGCAAVLALNDGPFITMLALGVAGLASFPITDLVAMIVPLVLGFALGNLSPTARAFLKPGESLLIPFLGFLVGASIDFRILFTAGAQGLVLGLATIVLSGCAGMLALWLYHVVHRHPHRTRNIIGGAAEGTVAGNAIATPAAIALADPTYAALTDQATAQIAAAVVFTTLLVPFTVSFVATWQKRRGVDPAAELEHYQSAGKVA
ncbi:2-keto-3-deoxygluconate permease [Actinomyces sp. MRS3W]|uniref:2-keto-3-deoxygluconate permease n=1 Tax=Actinomyces sp. MRS3W TaxID=2800796 RepID=UPI0028FD8B4D|nr:2-keto-3-deoxygluconate permease [Actinomyces sp. MRS3W]MDU0348437.1 2-keto-3-deoxygluconate permease [Actinomyces sp. MRS3W]